jgi:hypothetical protein
MLIYIWDPWPQFFRDDSTMKQFWAYHFLVEYAPADDEKLISGIFGLIKKRDLSWH